MFLGHIGIALVVCLVLVFFVLRPLARNIKEMEGGEEPLVSGKSSLRQVTLHLTRIAEKERKALARELHDRVGQDLSAINVNLNIIKNTLASIRNEDLEKRLLDTMDLVQKVTAGIRNVMYDLRPEVLINSGLVPALRWTEENAREMEISDLLMKPISMKELANVVRSVLDTKKSNGKG